MAFDVTKILSATQLEILSLLDTEGRMGCCWPPGTKSGKWFWEEDGAPRRDISGRSCVGLLVRGFIKLDGDRYNLTDAGRAALSANNRCEEP